MAFVLVTVHCKFVDYTRTPIADGTVTFTPAGAWINSAADDVDYVPRKISRELEAGEATVTVLASTTADPLIKYHVEVRAGADSMPPQTVTMPTNPADGVTLEFSDRDAAGLLVAPTAPPTGGFSGNGNGGFGA